jgi:hypothetical protein
LQLNQPPPVALAPTPQAPVDPKKAIPHQDLFVGVNTVEKCIEYIKTVKIPHANQPKINELLAYLQAHKIYGVCSHPLCYTAKNLHQDKNHPYKTDIKIPTDAKLIDAQKDDNPISGHSKSAEKPDYSDRMNDLGKSSPIRGRDKSLTDEDKKSAFGQAVDILAKLTKKDVGSVGTESYGGTYDAATKVQKFTNRVIKELHARFGKVSFDKDGTKRTTFPDSQGEKMLEYVNGEVAKLRSSSVR